MFVLIGVNGNIYYQFVNPSTQFEGYYNSGTPVAFRGNPFQLGPTQNLNCGPTACVDYFGGSIVEGYARLTARDADACPGNFDHNDVFFEVNGIQVGGFTGPNTQRTNMAGTVSYGFESCFRDQSTTETSTAWFDLTPVPGLLNNILTTGGTTPWVRDNDVRDNHWFFKDGNDASGSPEVAPGITIVKTSNVSSYNAVGDVIVYSFEVENIGSVTLNNIVVTDSFINSAVSCPFTSRASGQSMTCTGSHTVTQANIDDDTVFTNTASVTANPTEGTLGSVSGTLSIPGPAPDNSMTIVKTATPDSGLELGDVISYTYVVTNTGNITLDSVNVTDVHDGAGTLSTITPNSVTLAPGASQNFTATYTVTQGDIDAFSSNITNTATANATPKRGTITAPSASESAALVPGTGSVDFTKVASPDSGLSTGDVVTYTYSVTNTGAKTLKNLSVTDNHNGSGSLSAITPASITTLAPGDSASFTASYTITPTDFAAGVDITNTGRLQAIPMGTEAVLIVTADESVSLNTPIPSVVFTKSASPDSEVAVGDVVTYTYEVTNDGNVALNNVSISDAHNGAGALSAISPSNVPLLIVGNTATFTATYTVTQADIDASAPITNTATANATPAAGSYTPATADESVGVVAAAPKISFAKAGAPNANLNSGDVVTYTYEVKNSGNITLNNVSVNDVHNGSGALSTITPASASIAPGDTAVFTASYTITQADFDAGLAIGNIATATGEPANGGAALSRQANETVSLNAPAPSGSLAKSASPNTNAAVGDTITYTYSFTNTGNVTLNGVSISDVHNGNGTLSAVTPASVTSVAPGDSVNFTATYVMTQADMDMGPNILNTATANATPTSGSYTPATDTEVVERVQGAAAGSMTKVASPDSGLTVGDTVTYTYTVTNTGNLTYTTVSVSDAHSGTGTLSAITPTSITNVAPGDTAVFTATYVVTQADVDAGADITNTATFRARMPRVTKQISGTANETVSLNAPAPSGLLAKSASPASNVGVGDTITYSYLFKNTGNVTLTGVSISDV
ncbi:MAG: beta strand repeat-containing protein, partial [Maricaulaceae bacterium]